jgi:hypothetical protein
MYRFIAAHAQTHILSFFYSFVSLSFFLVFGGFILPKRKKNIIVESTFTENLYQLALVLYATVMSQPLCQDG